MCGIACLIDYMNCCSVDEFAAFTDKVSHRGPDDRGLAFFANAGNMPQVDNDDFFVALGHRRLSILDLTDAGHQPMFSDDNNYAIVFNGEIYNYIELREELRSLGHTFKSDCDTEVLLKAYITWGTNCVSRFNGMWSFVILDRLRHLVFMSRDRIGIKPLYYYLDHTKLAIASEIKQILSLKDVHRKPNDNACLTYLVSGYENAPETFFENIFSFPPGHIATVSLENPLVEPIKYWFPETLTPDRSPVKDADLIENVRHQFTQAVKLRLRSDVPVGGCLSGGLDSSAIFVEMKKLSEETTFSAFSSCFDEPGIDERPFMKSVIDQTASKHFQVFPNADSLMDDLDSFLMQHDEPVGSISMYAQYKVMQKARDEKVPVLLDGQGGDELFSGYWPAYLLYLNRCKNRKDYVPIVKNLLGAMLPGGNFELIRNIYTHFFEYKKRSTYQLPFAIKKELVNNFALPQWHLEAQKLTPANYRKAEILQVHLPRLLKWEDRNSMAFSIESRVPFLDINLVETLLRIKPAKNMHAGWNKYLFRKAMSGRLPNDICWRKDKKGFETPQEKWMKTGLFHEFLLAWSMKSEHPVADYVSTPFKDIKQSLEQQNFDSTAMFRLFCLDYWLKNCIA